MPWWAWLVFGVFSLPFVLLLVAVVLYWYSER